MTESSGFIGRGPVTHEGFAAPAITAKPALAALRSVRVPAHVVVLMGLSAGAYAIAVAGVTGLQSRTESALAAARAPAIAAIETSQQEHARLEQRVEAARKAYEAAAAAYAATGNGLSTMESTLGDLVGVVTEINGSTASLPTSVKLPAISGSVSVGAAPVIHATTTASGG